MPPKPFTKIALASFIIATLGILTGGGRYSAPSHFLNLASVALRPFNMSWFQEGYILSESYFIDVIQLSLSLSLLVAAVIYVISKRREILLLRFLYSLIFMSKAIGVIFAAINIVFFGGGSHLLESPLRAVIFWLSSGGYLYISHRILQQFWCDTIADTEEYGEGENRIAFLMPASRWARFFHVLFNSLAGVMLFSPIIRNWLYFEKSKAFLLWMGEAIGDRPALYVVIIFCAFIYYFISETILGTNPAMLLSGTRVTTEDGEKPLPGAIIKRTLSRFIPFDGLSFLFGSGWHDNLSKTLVVKEKRHGINPGRYFLAIVAVSGFIFLYRVAISAYTTKMQEIEYREKEQTRRAELMAELNAGINHISTSTFFRVAPRDYYSQPSSMLLKVENIAADSITVAKLYVGYRELQNQAKLESRYLQQRDSLDKVKFSRRQLKNALNIDNGRFGDAIGLKINGQEYVITKIETLFAPNISLTGGYIYSGGGQTINISLRNDGWKATLTDVKVEEGDVLVQPPTRRALYASPNNPFGGDFQIYGTSKTTQPSFKIRFSIVDTLGRKQVYRVSGDSENQQGALKKIQ